MSNKVVVDTDTGVIEGRLDTSGRADKQNRDFVQLYRKFISDVADLGMADSQALRVFLFLVRHMDGMNAIGVPMQIMSDMLGLSRQTVSAKIKYLEQHGWICIYKLGKSNIYVINPEIVWTSYGDQKAYSKFQTTVMLSGADNWEIRKKDMSMVKYIDPATIRRMTKDDDEA